MALNYNNNYSVEYANKLISDELIKVNTQIMEQLKFMSMSPKNQTKQQYIQLEKLNLYRDQLTEKMKEINSNQKLNDKTAKNEEKIEKIDNKNAKLTNQMNKSKIKFIKEAKRKKIQKLNNKKGKIQNSQRKIVNKLLLSKYKEMAKQAKKDSKYVGIDSYYNNKLNNVTTKENQINSQIKENGNIIDKAKNNYYKLRILPLEQKRKRLENLKQKNITKMSGKNSKLIDLINLRKSVIEVQKANNVMEQAPTENIETNIINFQERSEQMERHARRM